MIKVSVFKVADTESDFKTTNKKFIGCFYVMWKECVEKEKDGESPWLHFHEELRDPDGKCHVDLSGSFSGQCKWIKFGSANSGYNAKGEKLEEKALVKTAADTRGKKVGAAGTLQVYPRKYSSPNDLNMSTYHQIKMELRNKAGDLVAESLCEPSVEAG